ncbi:MAG: cyclic nucleotide-binding domain-containing protein [Nitrospirae bacterium]|nr:cyclic nucleotide-binding domain-containing protein [Nitrospirota bacterium]MCL5236433.1 cyclic nucleotide-binding domain-containing protein [Nitrospirota bacterium]
MNSFWGNIFKSRENEQDDILTILKKIPIFRDLNNRDLNRVERILHRREYRQDEIIFHQGDPGLGMYIIESGLVSIVLMPAQLTIAELYEGEFFGELSLLDDSPRTATAVAKTPCKMLCLFQPDLFDLIDLDSRLGVKILLGLSRTIGERLKRTNEHVHILKCLKIQPETP